MPKFITITIGKGKSAVISRIARETDVPGYTVGVLEPFFPSDEEVKKWSKEQLKEWTDNNNQMMLAVCHFLNTAEDVAKEIDEFKANFNKFINERIKMASSDATESAYIIVKDFVNKHI